MRVGRLPGTSMLPDERRLIVYALTTGDSANCAGLSAFHELGSRSGCFRDSRMRSQHRDLSTATMNL